ncbi:MAG: CHAT domain-containing protein [candidate division KSB1 bacterium]|nr:CHAT domain-containing protein [candidate division KSB1 bacterium]MDZ7407427.1 CHAT domain-containing protein [candidate division KSB1 bacterium]
MNSEKPSFDYQNFDLLIEPAGEAYVARVTNSPAGEAATKFNLPFSAVELENFLLKIGRPRRGVRRLNSPEMEAAKVFGRRLFDSVFGSEVFGCLRSSLDQTEAKGSAGLRLRLRLNAPELADLPWEYLYNSALNRFLVLTVETPLVRYLELPERIRPLAVQPPLKILVMLSSPTDHARLDVEEEWTKLQNALGDLQKRKLVSLERLDEATLLALQRRLRQSPYHIFHFIGHGGYDESARDGVLLLEDETRHSRKVSGQFLGTILHNHRPLRLAVLNACEGARASRTDPFTGTAQSLVQQGLPAVIAMQFEITDAAAITLSHEFYTALADGYPVDAALVEARTAIFAAGNDVEWGTPVLYMRAPDGKIFDIARAQQPPPIRETPKPKAPPIAPPCQPVTEKPKPVSPPPKSSGSSQRRWLIAGMALTLVVLAWLIYNNLDLGQPPAAPPLFWSIPTTPDPVLRSSPLGDLSVDEVKSMLAAKGFFDSDWNKSVSGFANDYELKTISDEQVVVDKATGLMWQRGGSLNYMNYAGAEKYIRKLNADRVADFSDWRLPTLEEAMSLMEPRKLNGDLYIDPKFDKTQRWIWTADKLSAGVAWVAGFSSGNCDSINVAFNLYVRAVRGSVGQ